MILSDRMIREAMARGEIAIQPFDIDSLGSNSYDVHLGRMLKTYDGGGIHYGHDPFILDCKVAPKTRSWNIPSDGSVLEPGQVYLGVTQEYTSTRKHVPFLDGKSSVGRLGISIHCTAGRGDVGFSGHWTLEIYVQQPVRIYAGMPIGQLIFFESGPVDVPYDKKPGAKYTEISNEPQASMMFRNFTKGK